MFGPLIVKPGTTRKSATGSWRIKVKPKFKQKECIGCKLCILVCPEACIEGSEKNTYYCDFTYCKGCGLCASVCPKMDIEMVEEAEQKDTEKTKG